jgi:hypothetical protein
MSLQSAVICIVYFCRRNAFHKLVGSEEVINGLIVTVQRAMKSGTLDREPPGMFFGFEPIQPSQECPITCYNSTAMLSHGISLQIESHAKRNK